MTSNPSFNAKTTASQAAEAFKDRIKGKYFLITGSNTGLGKETARVLAKEGGIVTILSRSVSKGEEAKEDILKEHPQAAINVLQLDLGSLKSVKACAEAYIATGQPLHVLINNAGIMANPYTKTSDGFESQFGTNHLGHFYLTELLLPLLDASGSAQEKSRVVNLSSIANILLAPPEGILFDDLDGTKHYNEWTRYGQSKLANILFTVDFQKKMVEENRNVGFVTLHPGNINTNLTQYIDFFTGLNFIYSSRKSILPKMLSSKTVPEGAATTVVCALDPKIEFGKYYFDCQVSNMLHERAMDEVLAAKLTTVSRQLIESAISKK